MNALLLGLRAHRLSSPILGDGFPNRMHVAVFCLVLLLVWPCRTVAAQGRGPLELATAPVPAGALRTAYGSDPLQFGELRLPTTVGPHPVAIVVHGGCWVAKLGNLDERAVALDNMRPLAAALTEAGIASWNVEYRRLDHEGGGWPGTFLDVANAADHLRTLAREHPLDLTRVIAIGHSAGGHLAVWLAARGRLPADSELHAADPLRYRVTSPVELLPLGVRVEVHAGRMFAEQARAYEVLAQQAGDVVTASVIPDAGHFVFIDPESAAWPGVLASVRRLLGLRTDAP